MTVARVRIETASRLHFGLLAWGARAARQFGGVGLMIGSPRIELVAERAPAWTVVGPLAARVEQLIAQLEERAREVGAILSPCRIAIEFPPSTSGWAWARNFRWQLPARSSSWQVRPILRWKRWPG
jgi:hypothetical protein